MTNYMPEAEFNVTYCKSVPLIPGAIVKEAFQQTSSAPFSLIANDELADLPYFATDNRIGPHCIDIQ